MPSHIWKALLILLLMLLAFLYGYLAFHLGTGANDGGPDELTRYLLPLSISHGNLLPRGDDPATIGPVGNYSYAFYPQMLGPYLQALLIWVARMLGLDAVGQLIAARFCSVAFGVLGAYIVGESITHALGFAAPNKWGFLGTAVVGLWPQYAFLSSYVNNDIIAFSGVAIMILGLIKGEKQGWKISNALTVAAGISVSALSYLNTYGFILMTIIAFVISVSMQLSPDFKAAFKIIAIAAIFCAVSVIPFMLVCLLRYGDPFGNSAFSAAYENWVEATGMQTMVPYSNGLIALLTQTNFLTILIRSFVGTFGYMTVFIERWKCVLLLGPATILAVLYCIKFLRFGNQMTRLLITSMILGSAITVFLVIWRTLTVDYQAQGRYIISVLAPLAIASVLELEALTRRIRDGFSTVLVWCVTIVLLLVSIGSFYNAATIYSWVGPTAEGLEEASPYADFS